MNKAYLSIDLDFWNHVDCERTFEIVDEILLKLKKNKIPILAVMNHQQLLPDINQSKTNVLINIDKHSDLVTEDVNVLDCGTWGAYVRWRKNGTFVWIHPTWGRETCDVYDDIFPERRRGVNKHSSTGWPRVENRAILPYNLPKIYNEFLPNTKQAGFVFSPGFTSNDNQWIFKEMVKIHRLPYRKGRMDEHTAVRHITPPGRTISG